MEANEIMVNEDVMEVAPEVVADGSGKALQVVEGIAIATVVGFIFYKLGKRIYKSIKARKELKAQIEEDYTDVESNDNADNVEEDSE